MTPLIDQAYLERRLARCREFEAMSTHPDVRNAYAGEVAHCEQMLATLHDRANASPDRLAKRR